MLQHPLDGVVEDVGEDFGILAAGLGGDEEGLVGVLGEDELCLGAEFLDRGVEQVEFGQWVA